MNDLVESDVTANDRPRATLAWLALGAVFLTLAFGLIGCVGGVGMFFQQMKDKQGASGIILMAMGMGGVALGVAIGSIGNIVGIVLGSVHLKRTPYKRGMAITAIVLNSLLVIAGGAIGLLVLAGIIGTSK